VPVKSRLSVTTADAALGAAVAGLGLTRLLCYQASKAIEAKQLPLLLRAYEPELTLGAAQLSALGDWDR
jgi:hypothetical protein